MKPAFSKIALLAGLVLAFSATIFADTVLKINHPRVIDSPPGTKLNGAYMLIENNSDKPVVITAVTSDVFEQVMIHKNTLEGQMTTMVHQNQVEIPAQGSFEFKPGGYHLMLMNRKHDLKPGDSVELSLILQDGTNVDFVAKVYKTDNLAEQVAVDDETMTTNVAQYLAQKQHDKDITFIFFAVGIAINILMIIAFLFWAYKQWNIKPNHNK